MHWYYLLLDLGTLFFPLVLSFDKNVYFVQQWKKVFLSSLIVGIPFIIWDIYFTANGIWGFNPDYLTGINIFNLPLEEVLFFLVVPFACIFIYECCKFYLKRFELKHFNIGLIVAIFIYTMFLFLTKPLGYYTFTVYVASLILLFFWSINLKFRFMGISYLISLFPFLLMNGCLTGMFTESPVVWYNENEFSTYRIITIPFEDVVYSFSLIVGTIIVYEYIKPHKIGKGN